MSEVLGFCLVKRQVSGFWLSGSRSKLVNPIVIEDFCHLLVITNGINMKVYKKYFLNRDVLIMVILYLYNIFYYINSMVEDINQKKKTIKEIILRWTEIFLFFVKKEIQFMKPQIKARMYKNKWWLCRSCRQFRSINYTDWPELKWHDMFIIRICIFGSYLSHIKISYYC